MPSSDADNTGGTIAAGTDAVRRRAAWIGIAVLAALIVVGLASGGAPRVTEGRVLVVGDSLTNGSNAAVRSALTDAGWEAVVDGRGGWSIGRWREPLVQLANFARPDVAIVALGTNNCDRTCRRLDPEIDGIIETLLDAGAQEIYWVNVQESAAYPADPATVNDAIARAVVRWPQVRLIDLDAAFDGHPEWHGGVGDPHFNEAGAQQFGALLVKALAARP